MSANASLQFQRVEEKGWRRGLGNLLQGEYSAWFKSSRWWKHIILWFAIINGMMGIMIYATAEAAKDGEEGPTNPFHVRPLRRDVRRLWGDDHHAAGPGR